MHWIDLLFIVIIGTYCAVLVYFSIYWYTGLYRKLISGGPHSVPGITVLVPARNERENIRACLDALFDQTWEGDIQVVLIDDHSEDGTADHALEKYGGRANFCVLTLPEEVTGKKNAMAYALDRLDTEWVFTIDGDCVPNTGWIESVMSAVDNGVAVTGPVLVKNPRGIFEGYQAMDLLSLALVTGGGMRAGIFTLANGGNMAFNTSAYREVGGYSRNNEHASGDDVFLMQNLASMYGPASVKYAQSPRAITYTWAEPTLGAFISQRRRWASKNAHLPQAAVRRLWAFIWFANFGFLVGVALTIGGLLPLPVFIVALMMKFGVEYAVLYRIAAHYQLTWQMRYFPTSFVINLIYTTGVAVLPLLGTSYIWKGRKTR